MLSPDSQPLLHFGSLQGSSTSRVLGGFQFQPSDNLILGGLYSPYRKSNDLSLYYHIMAAYLPTWKLTKHSTNMFQLGMHRNRFGNEGDSRWYSFSWTESFRLIDNLHLNITWNRLFTQKWERNTIAACADFSWFSSLILRFGALTKFTPDVGMSPFLQLSFKL